MRAILIAALIACGGGGTKPTAPTPVEKPTPKADAAASAELTGAVKQVRVDGGGSMRGAIETAMGGLAGKPLDPDQVRAALTNVMATPGVMLS